MAISQKLEQALLTAGIDVSDPCNYEKVQGQLIQINEQFQDEVKKTVDDLSYKTFGNFFVVTAALLEEALGGASVAIVDHFVGKALLDNALGAVSGAISMIFATLPGAAIILKYYAASTLREDLIRRQNLARILIRELNIITHWVDVLAKSPIEYTRKYYKDMRKAFFHISRARRTINIEATKYLKRANYISGENVQYAITDIDAGISYLTPGFEVTSKLLKDFHRKYLLQTRIPEITGKDQKVFTEYGLDWFAYIRNIASELKNKFTNDQDAYISAISEMLPALPDFLRKFAVNYIISSSSKILVDRLPIWLLKNKYIEAYVVKRFSTSEIPDYFGVTNEDTQYAMFANADTKEITWQRIMEACQLDETSLLLVPIYMDIVTTHSGLIQTIIKPADTLLANVYEDMKATLATSTKDAGITQTVINKKFGSWILKLEAAKSILKTATSDTGAYIKGFGETANLNTVDMLSAMEKIDIAMLSLEEFIKTKTATPPESGDQVLTLANTYLLSLISEASVFALNALEPNAAKTTLVGLKAIKVLLDKQYRLDREEQILVEDFINATQQLPSFNILKRSIDNSLNGLESGNSKVAKNLVNQIRHGDLSGLSSFLDVASFSTGAISCAVKSYISNGGNDESVMSRVQEALSSAGVSVKQQAGISAAIVGLKKKSEMLLEFTSIIKKG
ncbi:MAG TPA: hypothetical protein PKN48_00445 [Bacteroidales bacterium]|nr:hypothetical protein [Bacteroidales bacterium]